MGLCLYIYWLVMYGQIAFGNFLPPFKKIYLPIIYTDVKIDVEKVVKRRYLKSTDT